MHGNVEILNTPGKIVDEYLDSLRPDWPLVFGTQVDLCGPMRVVRLDVELKILQVLIQNEIWCEYFTHA